MDIVFESSKFEEECNNQRLLVKNHGADRYDALIKQAAIEQNSEARFELFQKAETILMDEMPVIPIYFYVRSTLIDEAVRGWQPNILDYHP